MKRTIRGIVGGAIVGLLSITAALAGIGVHPFDSKVDGPSAEQVWAAIGMPPGGGMFGTLSAGDLEITPEEVQAILDATVTAPTLNPTPEGTFLIGASRGSLDPAPTLFGGTTWQTVGCTEINDDYQQLDQDHLVASMEDMRGWPAASPDCIYLGGFGIGPARAAHDVDAGGVWIRSIAISNGVKTFVYQIADLVGWFSRYDAAVCSDCGILDVRNAIAAQVGLTADDVITGSTHSHATADTYGGWGGIPSWYRNQIRDTVIASAKQAIANLEPARIYAGEAILANRNNERRDTYFSNADTGAAWLQARRPPDLVGNETVIATLSTFAAHPTMVSGPILHADWPGAAARQFEASYGGVGLMFEGGLGNMSVSGAGSVENTGKTIAAAIGKEIDRAADLLTSSTMTASVKTFTHPVLTNPGLTGLASAGFFDREFIPGTPGADGPGAYHWSKPATASVPGGVTGNPVKGEFLRSCDTASPVQIRTVAGAHRIGGLLIAFAPGEIFSNISEVVKEKSDGAVHTLVFGQTNDALGYIIQSFEFDYQGGVVTEYGTQTGEYEEVFSIDHCFGDHVLETMLQSAAEVGLR